ncbi:cupin domain-containing protein [Haloferula helveola]|uniref:Cupin domain-containing protein n=1 Tax=Haloferula helveola TaxID=490095 RepID=A0ABM7RC78_9BACT|nr:cupin domain-containing protein [Haloferula helveola]
MKKRFPILVACTAATAAIAQVAKDKVGSKAPKIVKADDVAWGALNPARGEKGPRAGSLWNDRTAGDASGFLVRFADGFSSPPHIHNVTYRGVVISGKVHNDDPEAAEMWMPPGSFWTQPAGEVHITAAKGENVMAYIEIDSGPYLVLPKEEAFDKGERPVNVVPSNLVWLSGSETDWIGDGTESSEGETPEIAFLWGDPGSGHKFGSFLRLPKGFSGALASDAGPLRVVMVKGEIGYAESDGDQTTELGAGEYFELPANGSRHVVSASECGCVAYLQASGPYRVGTRE